MNVETKKDFKKATQAFIKNKELIQKQFNGKIFNIELDSKVLSDVLDRAASTDMFVVAKNGLVYGIALRFNFTESWHEKVTIRYKRSSGFPTEYEKTIRAFKSNAVNSSIGLQVDSDNLLNAVGGIIYDRFRLFEIVSSDIEYYEANHLHIVKSDKNQLLHFNRLFFIQNKIRHLIF